MSRKANRVLALCAAATLSVASMSVSAAEWRLSGYETSNDGISPFYQQSALIYQEFDDNGYATGRQVSGVEAQAEGLRGYGKLEFKEPWVDRTYPNNEYAKMYVEGNYSGRVFATGRFGEDVTTYRNANYMWEAAAPYKVYTRTQAFLSCGWYTDLSYPSQYEGENAVVRSTRPYYGFGEYNVYENGYIELIPEHLKAWRDSKYANVTGGLTIAQLAPQTGFNPIEFNGNDLRIPRLFDLALEGPSYNFDGSIADPFGVKLLASETRIDELNKYGTNNLLTTLSDSASNIINFCDITWTSGGYEVAPPHRTYQFLTVDGVVMNGSAIPGTSLYKPYIYRYVGNANPVITWYPDSVSANNEVILRRFVDGVKDTNNLTGLKASGIFVSPEYMEVIDPITATKSLDAVYRFNYNGQEYSLDTNGNQLVVDWSNDVATKVFTNTTYLSPYIAE